MAVQFWYKVSQGFLAFLSFKLVNKVNENWSSENTNGMKILFSAAEFIAKYFIQ